MRDSTKDTIIVVIIVKKSGFINWKVLNKKTIAKQAINNFIFLDFFIMIIHTSINSSFDKN